MLETGFLVALGLLFTMAKLSWPRKMWMISHPLTMDIGIAVLLLFLHWGTFSGVMAATVGAMFCSMTLAIMKWLVGHVENGRYFPGVFNIVHKLRASKE